MRELRESLDKKNDDKEAQQEQTEEKQEVNVCDADKCFQYMRELPEKYEQLSLI